MRGYRDNRKRKFRYRLKSETVYFLEWLEQLLLDDIHNRGSDTRDLLGEMRGSLGELLRLLHRCNPKLENPEQTSRRVLFQLFKIGDLCQEISAGLADLNGRLLFFLVRRYEIDEVRQLIKEVDRYVETFLKQAYSLRLEILPLLERLKKEHNLAKLSHCHEVMEKERLYKPEWYNGAITPKNRSLFEFTKRNDCLAFMMLLEFFEQQLEENGMTVEDKENLRFHFGDLLDYSQKRFQDLFPEQQQQYTQEYIRAKIWKTVMPELEKHRFLTKIKPPEELHASEHELIYEAMPALYHYNGTALSRVIPELAENRTV